MKKVLLVCALLVGISMLVACGKPIAEEGDTVSVHYVGTLEDGSEFDSSRKPGRSPLEFTIGDGNMIAGFDQGVRGMRVGETKSISLPPEEAYGPKSEFQTVSSEDLTNILGEETEINVDDVFELPRVPSFRIVSIQDDQIVIEMFNPHELAGETLNFEIELLEIR